MMRPLQLYNSMIPMFSRHPSLPISPRCSTHHLSRSPETTALLAMTHDTGILEQKAPTALHAVFPFFPSLRPQEGKPNRGCSQTALGKHYIDIYSYIHLLHTYM